MSMQGDKVNREQAEGGFSTGPNETINAPDRESTIADMARIITGRVFPENAAKDLYDAGYRKFEIVEEDV